MKDMKALATAAHTLANELLAGECKDGCLEKERKRPLVAAEKKKGWAVRPFHGYDHHQMCNECAAYYLAAMTAVCLDDELRRMRARDGDA